MKIEIVEFIPSDKTEIASASSRNDQPEIFLAVMSEGPARNDVVHWYRRD